MVELSTLSTIRFMGKDAVSFLHNQLTANINRLDSGDGTFAALCQPKGRVIAVLLVVSCDNGITVLCHQTLAKQLVTHLSRFVIREDVSITLDQETQIFGSKRAIDAGDGIAPIASLNNMHYALCVPGVGRIPESESCEADFRAWELQQGLCWLTAETSELFLPQMLGLEAIGALDFRKGCFPGQEVVARLRYLGKLKRHPVLVESSQPLGAAILGELQISSSEESHTGVLVDQAQSQGRYFGFVVLRCAGPFPADSVSTSDGPLPAHIRWLNDLQNEPASVA